MLYKAKASLSVLTLLAFSSPGFVVPYFPVLRFHVLHFCATFSSLAFSSPAFFLVPHFHVSHFQSPHYMPYTSHCTYDARSANVAEVDDGVDVGCCGNHS